MSFLINLILLLIFAYLIGSERANSGKAVGFRSIALVMIGAYAFTSTSIINNNIVDYHVIAQIVTGISFVGAGLIFKDNNVHNLTTAILVWSTAAIGVLFVMNMVKHAIVISTVIYLILIYKK